MLKVGLTGNIAAGKSTVVGVWRSLGAVIVDADELARRAVEPGSEGLRRIVDTWGPEVLGADGALDRAALRRIVFADAGERARLEGIVHPAVYALREEEYRRAAETGAPLVVADIPLLFEAGLADEFDVVVLVEAPERVRERRLVDDRGLPPDEARRMIAAQMPSELKHARADVVIENDGTLAELEARSREVWEELARRAEAARG